MKVFITNESTSQLTYKACLADLFTLEDISDTTNDEKKALNKRMTPGMARLIRVIIIQGEIE